MDSGHLRLSRYSSSYRSRLLEGGDSLRKFLAKEGLKLKRLIAESPATIDQCLEKYVVSCHNKKKDGKSLRLAKHSILFVQVLRPDLKHNLRRSWETVKSWEETIPSGLRTPLPLCMLMSMMCRARMEAEEHQSQPQVLTKWLTFSALLGLGFFGLLRPGELLSLRRRHIALANSLTFARSAVTVAIEKPKNFRQLGSTQFVSVKQTDVCNWIAWVCADKSSNELLWPHSHSEFRRLFQNTCQMLLVKRSTYTPASLRAGGATYYFDETMDTGRLRLMGRWASLQSLEHYVQVGKSQQLLQTMSEKTICRVKTLIRRGCFLLALPAAKVSLIEPQALIGPVLTCCHGQGISEFCRRWARMDQEDEKSDHSGRAIERCAIR